MAPNKYEQATHCSHLTSPHLTSHHLLPTQTWQVHRQETRTRCRLDRNPYQAPSHPRTRWTSDVWRVRRRAVGNARNAPSARQRTPQSARALGNMRRRPLTPPNAISHPIDVSASSTLHASCFPFAGVTIWHQLQPSLDRYLSHLPTLLNLHSFITVLALLLVQPLPPPTPDCHLPPLFPSCPAHPAPHG